MNFGQTTLNSVILAVAVAAALALMLPTLETGFQSDDFLDLHHDFSAASFTRFEFTGFRPLTEAVYALDAWLWGERNPWGWHLTNLLLHCLCAFLFWRASLRLSGDGRTAAVAAAFFLISFAAVPSFARVSGRTAPASMAPFIAAVLFHSRYVSRRRPADLAAGLVLFLVSLFTKETALLCAPVFGLVSVHLGTGDRGRMKAFAGVTAMYLVPVAIYLAWRFCWLGLEHGYADTARLGFFMITNLLTLLRMPFSPWLDGIPLRMLALMALALVFIVRRPWRTKLLWLGLFLLPVATVANLPPRSYYAYACLPGAALIFGSAAGSVRGRAGGLLVALILLGCFLSARDEVSRFRLADAYTSRTVLLLDSLEATSPEGALIFRAVSMKSPPDTVRSGPELIGRPFRRWVGTGLSCSRRSPSGRHAGPRSRREERLPPYSPGFRMKDSRPSCSIRRRDSDARPRRTRLYSRCEVASVSPRTSSG